MLLGAGCPGLGSPEHGSWYFSADLPSASGERRRVRRGGFTSQEAAAAALERLSSTAAGSEPGLTTAEWLWRWLESRVWLRASTRRSYAAHMRGYLVPYLGGIPLAALTTGDVQGMFIAIARDERALGRPVGPATLKRIHATLQAALNGAVRVGLIPSNPGRFPELPRAARPRPQVWTPALTGRWEQEGWRPDVGVWTAEQTRTFLACVRQHRLYALFHLVALRGLRRGEAAGLAWTDLDLEAGQQAEREPAGARWTETGYVFTTRAGKPVGPDRLTRMFRKLVAGSGLPPVTLHGLRHGAATLALAAGADLKVVQDQLGHSTIVLTADTYTSVLPETASTAAELTAALLFPARSRPTKGAKPAARRARKRRSRHGHGQTTASSTARPDFRALRAALP
jgi:integrase